MNFMVYGIAAVVLIVLAYYLIFSSYSLFTITFQPPSDWDGTMAEVLQAEVVRIAVMLLLMGILHGLKVFSLSLIGRLLGMSRLCQDDVPQSGCALVLSLCLCRGYDCFDVV